MSAEKQQAQPVEVKPGESVPATTPATVPDSERANVPPKPEVVRMAESLHQELPQREADLADKSVQQEAGRLEEIKEQQKDAPTAPDAKTVSPPQPKAEETKPGGKLPPAITVTPIPKQDGPAVGTKPTPNPTPTEGKRDEPKKPTPPAKKAEERKADFPESLKGKKAPKGPITVDHYYEHEDFPGLHVRSVTGKLDGESLVVEESGEKLAFGPGKAGCWGYPGNQPG